MTGSRHKVGVVGGGPAGLFLARLLRKSLPGLDVCIIERNPRGATYGFGVTLGGGSLSRLREADGQVVERLERRMVFDRLQRVRLGTEDVDIEYAQGGGSIARLDLLEVLEEACEEVGIAVRHEVRAFGDGAVFQDCDLVVAADGAGSAFRDERAVSFGIDRHKLGNRFAWYGVDAALQPTALVFREALGGRFVAHYYAYGLNSSTFVAECDTQTWTKSGFSQMSDPERKAAIEAIFAPELDGAQLVENRSIWRRHEAIDCANWHDGRCVLIGDALRPAHFSIGSGTRLAMEDAMSLCAAIVERGLDDIPATLDLFEQRRKPVRQLFADAARESYTWYEDMASAMDQPPLAFAHSFLTRTSRIDSVRLEQYAPSFARRWAEAQAA